MPRANVDAVNSVCMIVPCACGLCCNFRIRTAAPEPCTDGCSALYFTDVLWSMLMQGKREEQLDVLPLQISLIFSCSLSLALFLSLSALILHSHRDFPTLLIPPVSAYVTLNNIIALTNMTVLLCQAYGPQGNFHQITRLSTKLCLVFMHSSSRLRSVKRTQTPCFLTVQRGLSCCLNVVKRLLFLVLCCCVLNKTAVMQLH